MKFNKSLSQTLWTPERISTALWLDAADSSTVTTVSGAVSQWADKSGNGRSPEQASATLRPTYSTNKLTFDGTNDQLIFPSSTVSNYPLKMGTSSFEFYAVINPTRLGPAIGTQAVFGARAFETGWLAGFFHDKAAIRMYASSAERWNPFPVATTASTGLQLFHATAPRGSTGTYRKDGNLIQSTTSAVGTQSMDVSELPVRIGAYNDGSSNPAGWFQGDIHEIIIPGLGSVLGTATREKIEGYLAHKWGLTANLPSNHPFKNSPPRGL